MGLVTTPPKDLTNNHFARPFVLCLSARCVLNQFCCFYVGTRPIGGPQMAFPKGEKRPPAAEQMLSFNYAAFEGS